MVDTRTVEDQTACVGAASPLPLRKRQLSAESAIKVPNPEATKLQKVGGAFHALSKMISKPAMDRDDLKPTMEMLQKMVATYLEKQYEDTKNAELSKDDQQFKELLNEALTNQHGDFGIKSALGSRFARQVGKGTEMHKEYLDFVEQRKKEGKKPNRAI